MSRDLTARVAAHNAGGARRPRRVFGVAVRSGDPADPLDALLALIGDDVLGSPSAEHRGNGEHDYYREHVSTRSFRRLVAAGLIRRGGMAPDRLADVCGWEGDPSSFVEWYVTTALAGLDHRAEVREGTPWHERERTDEEWAEWAEAEGVALVAEEEPALSAILEPAIALAGEPAALPAVMAPATAPHDDETWPPRLAEYLDRLLHAPKREHALRVARAARHGEKIPTCRAKWSRDVETKVLRYLARHDQTKGSTR